VISLVMALSPSAAANRRFGFQIKPEITPPPIPTNPGTAPAGAIKPKRMQAYLDEFAFRFNLRKTNGVGRIAARTIEQLVARPPLTTKMLILETVPCRASGAKGLGW
jgi:hypothetical protein